MVKPEIIALHKTGSFCFALTLIMFNLTISTLIAILLPSKQRE